MGDDEEVELVVMLIELFHVLVLSTCLYLTLPSFS